MKKLLYLLVLAPFVAYAGTAFFKYEIAPAGSMTKICVYDYLGSDYAITIKSYQICPISIRVP